MPISRPVQEIASAIAAIRNHRTSTRAMAPTLPDLSASGCLSPVTSTQGLTWAHMGGVNRPSTAVQPPSTARVAPVTKLAASDAR
ncbi:hypothetical protein GCM10023321_33620 [Pseudonocardia eucalypti]|uniref:Uncharacterized protein n=1 Tax=Pseudonocardia eucalypti TaxID=648755 RepID=A0ABP9Q4R8_9PSEU